MEYDSETGNYYDHARYYNPRLGRFMSPDPGNAGASPGNPQSWNGYSYVLNNPETLIDPSGLACENTAGETVPCPTGTSSDHSYILAQAVSPSAPSFSQNDPAWWFYQSLLNPPPPNVAIHSYESGPPPITYWQVARSFNQCAANFAEKHSAASTLHLSRIPGADALLGSLTADVSNLVFGKGPSQYVPAGANLVAGVKAGSVIAGGAAKLGAVPVDGGFQSLSTTILPTRLAETAEGGALVSGAKSLGSVLDAALVPLLLWDEAMYGVGEGVCTAQAY